jgi:hypothetical protein
VPTSKTGRISITLSDSYYRIKALLRRYPQELHNAVNLELHYIGKVIARHARDICPREGWPLPFYTGRYIPTGNLRKSIDYDVNEKNRLKIWAGDKDAYYARWVHNGAILQSGFIMPPRRFLFVALFSNLGLIKDRFERLIADLYRILFLHA